MGNTFPGPGLFSKFYDTDHEPLVEVIRDTVGKHDTFNLARLNVSCFPTVSLMTSTNGS